MQNRIQQLRRYVRKVTRYVIDALLPKNKKKNMFSNVEVQSSKLID